MLPIQSYLPFGCPVIRIWSTFLSFEQQWCDITIKIVHNMTCTPQSTLIIDMCSIAIELCQWKLCQWGTDIACRWYKCALWQLLTYSDLARMATEMSMDTKLKEMFMDTKLKEMFMDTKLKRTKDMNRTACVQRLWYDMRLNKSVLMRDQATKQHQHNCKTKKSCNDTFTVLSRWWIYDLWRYIHDIFLVLSRAIHLWYVYGAFQSECVVKLWCKIYDDIFLMIHLCDDTFMVLSRASMRYIYDNIFLILRWYIYSAVKSEYVIHSWRHIYDFHDTFMR